VAIFTIQKELSADTKVNRTGRQPHNRPIPSELLREQSHVYTIGNRNGCEVIDVVTVGIEV
jgi:hypothetical protein